MQEQLRALVRLAEIDHSARHIEEQLRGIPQELEERRAAVASLEALVSGQKSQMEAAAKLLAQQEEELRIRSGSLAKSKAKSAKARNMREAEAAERELDSVRRSIRDAEEERARLQGQIEQSKSVLDAPLLELEEQKQALAEAEAGAEAKLSALRAEHATKVAGRDAFVSAIPKPIYRRYERIRPKIHPTVVEAIDGVCTGCRMQMAPQLYNQIVAGTDLHQCQACQRFLYHRDAILE